MCAACVPAPCVQGVAVRDAGVYIASVRYVITAYTRCLLADAYPGVPDKPRPVDRRLSVLLHDKVPLSAVSTARNEADLLLALALNGTWVDAANTRCGACGPWLRGHMMIGNGVHSMNIAHACIPAPCMQDPACTRQTGHSR